MAEGGTLSASDTHGLPSGIVTFVLTDIEGSTSLFRRLGDAYSGLLQEHHRLLRAAFSAWDGFELGTEGDSFLIAFADAAAAVSACVDGQRSIQEHLSAPPAAIRVRMGVHTGPATPVGHEYVSLTIHQTARISAAAHGGQVLLSDATVEAVGARLVEGVQVQDLGLYQLRDFPDAQRLFQVHAPGVDAQFPPLRTLSVLAHNLPYASTRFVGRNSERSSLKTLLRDNRVVTIVGPGGVGKTRLAIETGHDVTGKFADGVWIVDLAPVRDPQHLPQAIAAALAVTPQDPPLVALVDALRPKRALLILDNCEHLVEAVASLVEELLGVCPNITILATSREALNIDGERVQPLRPMALPQLHARGASIDSDAVQLFLDRAAQSGAELDRGHVTIGQVAEIVIRLDGLPLAIELAAGTLQHLGVGELHARLAARFELLSRGRRTAPTRHRTLAAMIQWSFDLLSPTEQDLLVQLSVFRDGWTLAAARDVCADERSSPPALPVALESLCDKSLVVHEPGSTRFSMLETIREFAAAELTRLGPRPPLEQRYLRWCVRVGEEQGARLVGPDRPAAMQTLVDEEGNLRDALARAVVAGEAEVGLRLAVGLEPFWLAHGRWEGAAESLEVLLESPSLDTHLAARARTTVANLHLMAGRYDRAAERFDEAREIAGRIGDPSTSARALSGLGYVAFRSSKLREAESLWSQALLVCGDSDEWLRASILRSLAIAAGSRGDQMRASHLLAEAAQVARSVHDDQLLRLVLSASAEVNVWLARYETAREHYEESIRLATLIGDHTGRAVILAELGWLEYLTGDYRQAEKWATDAMELAEALQHTRILISALRVLGEVASGLGDADHGRRLVERAVDVARALASPSELGGALCSLACLHVDQLAIDEAEAVAVEALALEALAHTMKRATPEWVLGETARLRGAVVEAQSRFEAELAFSKGGLVVRHEAQALRGMAEVARAVHALDRATTLHHQALRRRSDIGDRVGVVNSLEGIARLAADAGAPRRAAYLLRAAEAYREDLGVPATPREARDVREARAVIEKDLTTREVERSWVQDALSPPQAVELALEDPAKELRSGEPA